MKSMHRLFYFSYLYFLLCVKGKEDKHEMTLYIGVDFHLIGWKKDKSHLCSKPW